MFLVPLPGATHPHDLRLPRPDALEGGGDENLGPQRPGVRRARLELEPHDARGDVAGPGARERDADEDVDKVTQDAMQIILHAGDARVEVKRAYELVAAGDVAGAREALAAADEKIVAAHHIQTEDIQAAIRGEKQDYSLLFAHAQDTLMTIYSEIIVAKQLVNVFDSYERRLSALEQGR